METDLALPDTPISPLHPSISGPSYSSWHIITLQHLPHGIITFSAFIFPCPGFLERGKETALIRYGMCQLLP